MNGPDSLSGGQKKLLVLCRALMLKPRLALLDEPVAGVNPVLVGEIADFIRTKIGGRRGPGVWLPLTVGPSPQNQLLR